MRYSAVIALSVMTAMVPQSSAQTQPAKTNRARTANAARKNYAATSGHANRATQEHPGVGPRVPQPAPQSEPLRGTPARERLPVW